MHSKNKAKAHQIKKERRFNSSLCLGACEVAGARAKGQTLSRLHTDTHTHTQGSPFLSSCSRLSMQAPALGTTTTRLPQKMGTGAPPKSESVCLPPSLSLPPPLDDDAGCLGRTRSSWSDCLLSWQADCLLNSVFYSVGTGGGRQRHSNTPMSIHLGKTTGGREGNRERKNERETEREVCFLRHNTDADHHTQTSTWKQRDRVIATL